MRHNIIWRNRSQLFADLNNSLPSGECCYCIDCLLM